MSADRPFRPVAERRALLGVLLLGLIHGLVYVFVVPPWQHYDEPDHFEYAWLAANLPAWPEPGDFDASMRHEVARSMVEHGFYRDLGSTPDLGGAGGPIAIGFTRLEDPPFYYWLTSVPLRLLGGLDVTLQLYAARLVSLMLLIVSLWAAYGVTGELAPPKHPLRIMAPGVMALLPGYVDLMTSVNNDVGAVAVFSVFLWGAVRVIRRGVSLARLLWVSGAAILAVLTKNTAMLAVLLLPAVLLFAAIRGPRRWIAWSIVAAGAVVGMIAVFTWGDAAYWYGDTGQAAPTRATRSAAPVGNNAIRVEIVPGGEPPALHQVIPPAERRALEGETVSVGAWIWASEPASVRSPALWTDGKQVAHDIRVGIEPAFFAFTTDLSDGPYLVRVDLAPVDGPQDRPLTLFYDGLVLAHGERPTDLAPRFGDPGGREGEWGRSSFENMIRNGSAEKGWPRVRPWAASLAEKIIGATFYGPPSELLASVLDWRASSAYYLSAGANLTRTFWAKFGWGNVPLLGSRPYRLLVGFTLIGVAGSALALLRARSRLRKLNWASISVLGLALIAIWGLGLIRGAGSFWTRWAFIPGARFVFPAIIPTALMLSLGWLEAEHWAWRSLGSRIRSLPVIALALFLALDVYAVVSLMSFYRTR